MSSQKKLNRGIKQNANTQTKEQMLKEASMQEEALKHLVTWRAAALLVAAFGLIIAYCGFSQTYLPFAMGFVGAVVAILAIAFALIVNRGIRHGRKNVAAIHKIADEKESSSAVLLEPCCKDYLWGGEKLKEEYNISSSMSPLAEAWVLADHPDGQSIVASGDFKGLSFSEYLKKQKGNPLGSLCKTEECPVLIKLIDSLKPLSIQVHPDDDYAKRVENADWGKTEMWYILSAEPDAYLYFGFSKDITKEEFKKRIEENTLLEVLNKVSVNPGDVFFIESGTIHAIGPGITLCEVQQNSNLTYRVYDYGRTDANGKRRELHIEKALDVTNLKKTNPKKDCLDGGKEGVLASCPYFNVIRLEVKKRRVIKIDNSSFMSIVVAEGELTLRQQDSSLSLSKGSSAFLPAGSGTYELIGSGNCICTTLG